MRSLAEDLMMDAALRSLRKKADAMAIHRQNTYDSGAEPTEVGVAAQILADEIDDQILQKIYGCSRKPEPPLRFVFDVYALPRGHAGYRTWVRLAAFNKEME